MPNSIGRKARPICRRCQQHRATSAPRIEPMPPMTHHHEGEDQDVLAHPDLHREKRREQRAGIYTLPVSRNKEWAFRRQRRGSHDQKELASRRLPRVPSCGPEPRQTATTSTIGNSRIPAHSDRAARCCAARSGARSIRHRSSRFRLREPLARHVQRFRYWGVGDHFSPRTRRLFDP